MRRIGCLLFLCLSLCNLQAEEANIVVGIHGLLSSINDMGCICRDLACCGHEVYLWEYPSTEGTICEHARNLVLYLQEIATCRPDEPINFITHSVGALILRQALNVEGCPEEAKLGRAVLLAPPNQGSRLAREYRGFLPVHWVLGSKIGCELMTYDPCTIQSLGSFPSTMEVLVIAGNRGNNLLFQEPNDGFLAVSETALETPFYFQCFKLRHGALLTHPLVIQCACDFLSQPYAFKSLDPFVAEALELQ